MEGKPEWISPLPLSVIKTRGWLHLFARKQKQSVHELFSTRINFFLIFKTQYKLTFNLKIVLKSTFPKNKSIHFLKDSSVRLTCQRDNY